MKADTRDGPASVVSRNILVEGEIQGSEDLTVEGRVKGLMKVDGDILVAETGVVEADIEAGNVIVKGKVAGDVTVRDILEVHPGGELYGSIRARLIHIREGAVFEGNAQMIRSPAARQASDGAEDAEAAAVPEAAP